MRIVRLNPLSSLMIMAMATCSLAMADDGIAPPSQDETLIYILREGGGGKLWIAINDQTVARLENRKYEVLRTKAGLVTLNVATQGIPIAGIPVDDRHGEIVYLRLKRDSSRTLM